jgi:hypothetical protein
VSWLQHVKPTERTVRRARAIRAGRVASVLIAIGWAGAFIAFRGNWDVVISAAAFWLVFVLFVLAAWELVLMLTGSRDIGVLPRNKWLLSIETWLVPAALVVGLFFGHYLWS